MKQHSPELTIILATLNAGGTIERCLQSIASQSFRDFELIVIDGVSTDDTLDKIGRYTAICSYVESSPDNGIYSAWNKALKMAKGEWIVFIGADDYFATDTILDDLIKFAARTNADLITVRNTELNPEGEAVKVFGEPWCWGRFRRYMNICHVGVLHRRVLFEEYGLFDESYKIAGDYEFLMRAGNQLSTADFDCVVACCGNSGVSRKNIAKVFNESIRLQQKHQSTNLVGSYVKYGLSYLKLCIKNLLNRKMLLP
ncbi:MAG: glycosyltransferase family 2 protein [Sideroxydans sp.]|nr:glycosyltransferase family 2 protein [Sideroxydans sp.]